MKLLHKSGIGQKSFGRPATSLVVMPTALSLLVSYYVFLFLSTTFDLRITQSVEADSNVFDQIWCDFDRASSLICVNKMPARCNRGFYCRSYCLLNMFRAPLCPSSGAKEYYTVVAACGISCCVFQVAGLVRNWRLCVQFAGCCSILQTAPDQQLENHSTKYHKQQPLYNTLELLMMGIVVPKTCWASNKFLTKLLYTFLQAPEQCQVLLGIKEPAISMM